MIVKFTDIDGNVASIEADDVTHYFAGQKNGKHCIVVTDGDDCIYCDPDIEGTIGHIAKKLRNHYTPCPDDVPMYGSM